MGNIAPGTYTAKVASFDWGTTPKGNEQLALTFNVEGHGKITAYLYWTKDSVIDRSFESLRYCGWTGDDLTKLDLADLQKPVEIVVENEEWEGKTRTKVAWINDPNRAVAVANRMTEDALKKFAARMKSKVKPMPGKQDDIPF